MRWPPGIRRYLVVCAVVAAYPALTLFPFNWTAPQQITNGAVRDETGAIDFTASGIAESDGSPGWVATAMASHRFEVELRVRPADDHQAGPARMFTLSADPFNRNVTIAQEGRDLVIRLRTPMTNLNGMPAIVVPAVMDAARTVEIHFLVEPGVAEVRVDGVPRTRVDIPQAPLRSWNAGYRVALGNEVTRDRPWRGRIERATVRTVGFDVDYAAPDGALTIPPRYWAFHQPPQLIPFRPLAPGDIAANVLFFVPLGFLLGTWGKHRRPRSQLAIVVLIALALSITLELLQLFIPSRQPAITDVILNAVGAGIGAFEARRWPPRPAEAPLIR